MQLKSNERDFSSNLQSAGNGFTVKASPKAFDILSSGIYSDKEKAIVRELVCNAYDSHVDAGKLDTPFHVHVPNDIVPVFYVEDFGLGLSTDDVLKLYTSYFTSTKTESNDVVGALGLGSKSPFAYTDTFTVESTYQGVRTQFVAYKDADGLPMISEMGSTKVDAPNGLKVSVGIDSNDFRTFRTKIQEIMAVFNPDHYEILNDPDGYAKPKVFESTYTHENINFYKGGGNVSAIMGNIRYPINLNLIADHDRNLVANLRSFINGAINVHINFDIGDLDISASREELGYDNRTVTNIISQLEKIVPFFKSLITEAVDSADCWYDASVKAMGVIDIFNSNCNVKLSNYEFNNYPLQKRITLDRSWDWASFYHVKMTRGGNIARGDVATNFIIDKNSIIFCNDISRGVYPILNHNYSYSDIRYTNCYIVTFNHSGYLLDEGIEERFEQIVLGGKKMVKVSELEPAPKVKRETYKKTLKTEMYPIDPIKSWKSAETHPRNLFSLECDYRADDHDLEAGGVYLLTSRGKPECDSFYGILKCAYGLGLIEGIPLYVCPKAIKGQIKKMPQWMDFYEYVEKAMDEAYSIKRIDFFKRYLSAHYTLETIENSNPRFAIMKQSISDIGIDTNGMDSVSEYFFNKLMVLIERANVYKENERLVMSLRTLYNRFNRKWPLNCVKRSKKSEKLLTLMLDVMYNDNPILKFIDEPNGDDYVKFVGAIESLLKK